jgi:hypothetical protein
MLAHKSPRPGAFWFQFKADAKSRLPWIFWVLGTVEIGYGLMYHYRGPLVIGVGLFVAYVLMFIAAARRLRDCPAAIAVIDAIAPFGRHKGASTAVVPTADGEVRLVAMTELVAGFVGDGRRAEVVFLHVPRAVSHLVIAARRLRADPADPTPGKPV